MPGGIAPESQQNAAHVSFWGTCAAFVRFSASEGALLSVGEANTPRKFEFLQKPLDKQTPFRV